MQIKAPIPPPEPELTPHDNRPRVTYGPAIFQGFLITLVLLGVQRAVGLLWPGLFIITIYYLTAIGAAWQMKALSQRLNHTLREPSQLQNVRRVIDLNMKVAYLMMIVLWPLIIAAVLTGEFVVTGALMPSLLLSSVFMGIEKRFKAMDVDADPAIAAQFAEYLAQWKEPRFGLSP